MAENEVRYTDWAEYEAAGAPVKEFFMLAVWLRVYGAAHGADDAGKIAGPGESTYEEKLVEGLVETWLMHHPNGPYKATQGESSPPADWSAPVQPAVAVHERVMRGNTRTLPNQCFSVSGADHQGGHHACVLPRGHEATGQPHEDATHKWFSAGDRQPFSKTL